MNGCATAPTLASSATTRRTCATGRGRAQASTFRPSSAFVRVLVANAGSSSLKLSLLGADDVTLASCELAAPDDGIDANELRAALDDGMRDADVVGPRIVHGGERFRAAVRIDSDVEAALHALAYLAPLHQAKSLAAL